MAENGEQMEVNPQQMTQRTKIWATLAGIAIEAPILGLMGFSFLSSLILLVITSPLLLIFSPLLIGAAAVFGVAMAGFGVAGITAVLGLSSFVLVYRSLIEGRKTGGEFGHADDPPVTVDKMIQPAAETEEQEQQHDTKVAGTGGDKTEEDEAVKQQQGSTTSEPVTVDRMVELFESLKEHPHETETTAVTEHTVEIDDEPEEHQHDKDRSSSGGYLQQNVQRQIPQET
ncbi:hypothetical protein HAX54_007219 [Datura stramonium]|uniref:Oleosin n=1 Tax=Datura stramonium TaxID=4076 RepID=A0ABS8RWF5_DATST|nr:hypothetical protein [Datura stramonium]